jgi:hypothetical protein
MTEIRCEVFELEFASLNDNQAKPNRKLELEKHRQNCPHCRSFNQQTLTLRVALAHIPRLETSPQFVFNLRREINRLEHPRTNREMGFAPWPHSVAVSSGFVMAVILGFLFLRPGAPTSEPALTNNTPAMTTQTVPQKIVPLSPVVKQESIGTPSVSPRQHNLLASAADSRHDTLIHRLPEAPGMDSIPIPLEDDMWRMNHQVSTAPSGP